MEFQKKTPAEVGVNPQSVLNFLESIESEHIHIHSFVMMRRDTVFAQGAYTPYSLTQPHMLFSLSKSFTSVAIGFAVQEGLLKVQDLVLSFFEGVLPARPCENMEKMTIKNLLTMNTGHAEEPSLFFLPSETDWVYVFLSSYVAHEPGSHFLYNTLATYMLSAVLQKVTGETVFDYLQTRLFQPLGLCKDIWWETSPQGISSGGFGFNATTEDIAVFGTFLLHKGFYAGKQLLNSAWFDEATTPWSDNSMNDLSDWKQGYGYQFWMCVPEKAYRGDGAFGQYCVILPDQEMVIAINSGIQDMQRVLTLFWEIVLPAVSTPLEFTAEITAEMEEQQRRLDEKLLKLSLKSYYEEKLSTTDCLQLPNQLLEREFELTDNPFHITHIAFEVDTLSLNGYILSLKIGDYWNQLHFTNKIWTSGVLELSGEVQIAQTKAWTMHGGLFEKVGVKGCTNGDILYLDMAFINTPFQDSWVIEFKKGVLTAHIQRNVGFIERSFEVIGL